MTIDSPGAFLYNTAAMFAGTLLQRLNIDTSLECPMLPSRNGLDASRWKESLSAYLLRLAQASVVQALRTQGKLESILTDDDIRGIEHHVLADVCQFEDVARFVSVDVRSAVASVLGVLQSSRQTMANAATAQSQ